jgi:hypothetical protein
MIPGLSLGSDKRMLYYYLISTSNSSLNFFTVYRQFCHVKENSWRPDCFPLPLPSSKNHNALLPPSRSILMLRHTLSEQQHAVQDRHRSIATRTHSALQCTHTAQTVHLLAIITLSATLTHPQQHHEPTSPSTKWSDAHHDLPPTATGRDVGRAFRPSRASTM